MTASCPGRGSATAILMLAVLAIQCAIPHGIAEQDEGAEALVAGKTVEALRHYDEAIALNSKLAAAHCGRGQALVTLKRYGEAVQSLQTCVVLEPRDLDAKASLAEALVRACRYSEAKEALADLDRAKSTHPRTVHNSQWVRTRLERAALLGGRCLPEEE